MNMCLQLVLVAPVTMERRVGCLLSVAGFLEAATPFVLFTVSCTICEGFNKMFRDLEVLHPEIVSMIPFNNKINFFK